MSNIVDSAADTSILSETDLRLDQHTNNTSLQSFLTEIRRHIHANPELGLAEFETSRFIRTTLERHGLSVVGPMATTGLYVDIVGELPGPIVAYRADIDALPIEDAKSAPYKSQNIGIAHLCGHDAHTTIGIGIALLLHVHRNLIHGTVRVFFQPNEEGIPSGAPLMIQDGVLNKVSAVYCSHVDPTVSSGVYGLLTGAVTASADRFRVRVVSGSTGHSARPHQATDTIWIATQIMNALYQLVGRVSDARKPAVISICRLVAGEAYNVIPSMAEFGGTFRCTENEERELIKSKIEQTALGIGQTFGAEVVVDFDHGSPPVINDGTMISVLRETIEETLGADAIYNIPVPSMGAEDFAHYLDHVPGALIRVGTRNSPETSHVLHDSHFDIDESVLSTSARLLASTLIKLLEKNVGGIESS